MKIIIDKKLFQFTLCLLGALVLMGCSQDIPEQLSNLKLQDQTVRVTARMFAWEVTHPGYDGQLGTADDIATTNEIVVEQNTRVQFELTSKDVLHGFWIPYFGLRQALPPKARFERSVEFLKPGSYKLACSELCGVGHGKMMGWVRVLSSSDYQSWLQKASSRQVSHLN